LSNNEVQFLDPKRAKSEWYWAEIKMHQQLKFEGFVIENDARKNMHSSL